ncbi:MAG: LPS export ABC transporter periplasmic protein LptC [Brevinemataceae bacterium]
MNRLTILILTLLTTSSCTIKLGRNDREKRIFPSASMQDFLYTYTEKKGFREWELKAAQANIFETDNQIFLYNLTMTFFSESNQITSVLIANQGLVNQSIGSLIAEGEVRILSSNRSELLTEKIYWDQPRNLLYSETNKLVTVIRPKQRILGYNMISDSALENVEIDNSIGQINTDNSNSSENNTNIKSDITQSISE